ncbi:hypothetical protein AS589_05070 [Empedobacter brevis]|uniref:DUF2306 domain-containing protein n=1 Tax=Empedobacter brevis NBRC 14943 = ATCC 43319 TaxID=1218108 RepID=A0A511NEB8_9FLAO|nr:hypothetical protein [Empedobacter brevis]QHC84204.1 hypothetical protein AS589_05070 [Empedobacter brevis]GEM51153.1 hypothetical protein EB1_09430 [Empedobacter brevis NBRC 14943 = ATCC 43319]
MENLVKIIIYIHAFFGGIGLISGTVVMVIKKGNAIHKKMGKVFSVGMLVSSILSLVICVFPHHHNSFLLMIGIFTIYMILMGNRILKYKRKNYENKLDKIISGTMFLISIVMIIYGLLPLFSNHGIGILFLIFGFLGGFMSYRDFVLYNNPENYKKWTMNHVGKMVGAYIASVTAFLVAGAGFGGNIYFWIVPSVIGTIYIFSWSKKLNKKVAVN